MIHSQLLAGIIRKASDTAPPGILGLSTRLVDVFHHVYNVVYEFKARYICWVTAQQRVWMFQESLPATHDVLV